MHGNPETGEGSGYVGENQLRMYLLETLIKQNWATSEVDCEINGRAGKRTTITAQLEFVCGIADLLL